MTKVTGSGPTSMPYAVPTGNRIPRTPRDSSEKRLEEGDSQEEGDSLNRVNFL